MKTNSRMERKTFSSALQDELTLGETVRTENGAVMHASTGKSFLDAFWKISSCRNIKDEHEIVKIFGPCFKDDFALACRLLFYIRDCRQGCGEKRTFNIIFKWLLSKSKYVDKLAKLVPEYGSWKDVVTLAYETGNDELYRVIIDQFRKDLKNFKQKKSISLLAKWMPSINTSSKKTVAMARTLCKKLDYSTAKYRKVLSALRKHLKVIERAMCANEWGEIDYNAVPSKANLIYRNAFLKHDEARRRMFLSKLAKGDTDVKINADVLEPYEIVHQYFTRNIVDSWYGTINNTNTPDESCEALWKNLPRTDVLHGKNLICVHDNSGSMSSPISGNVTCRDVADSLAIYCSELLRGPWKNKFITFSESPKIVDLSYDDTLLQKIGTLHKKMQCENTNIERVFDLILDIAVENHVEQDDIPDVLVLSDMEFDGCVVGNYIRVNTYGYARNPGKETLFETIRRKFRCAGYEMPKLIFWNIGSRTMGIPVRENENGVALVSGFSKNIFSMVASGKIDPFECLKEQLMRPRYDAVEKAWNEALEEVL